MLDAKTKAVLERVLAVSERHHVNRLVLFGSRARGDHTVTSDFDIAVYGVDNAALFNADIDEIDTLHQFDIVHITKLTALELLENIERDGVVIVDKFAAKLNHFSSALLRLQEACDEYETCKSKVVRDGVIQRFEFTCELSWKTAREYLLNQGYTEINSPKAVMKAAFTEGLISDETGWVELLNARNLTAHVYDEGQAAQIYIEIKEKYEGLLQALFCRLN